MIGKMIAYDMMRRIDRRYDSSPDVNREVSDVMKSPAASITSPSLLLYTVP